MIGHGRVEAAARFLGGYTKAEWRAFDEESRRPLVDRAWGALAAADAVAAQDPAPRAEPAAWGIERDGDIRAARTMRLVAERDVESMPGCTIVALYRDPALRAEPYCWVVVDERGDWVEDGGPFTLLDNARWAAHRTGGTVIPLYRDPAPAPVVPDEADQATTDLRTFVCYFDDRVVTWPRETVERAYLDLLDRLDAGWRLVPPTEGAS